ncbi:MAG: toprim domain-containing protein [Firmicutes bacterium]|nr:toprim domain-containing protein [Bacillota bacterium]
MSYSNESISSLKGAERVRKRPSVIFGSDGIEGCVHCVFEILSNAIDEAREGFGKKIILTKYLDNSIEVEDFGRGIPVDFNKKENKYNWELLFTELYAGGKYNNDGNSVYEYSLGTNGLGLCATQYASEFMYATISRDGFEYNLSFKNGVNIGGLKKSIYKKDRVTGTKIRWKPDINVFTDIEISGEDIALLIKRQAVVNSGITFLLRTEHKSNSFIEEIFFYENGIVDYIKNIVGNDTAVQNFNEEKLVRDRIDKPEYKLKINVAMAFSNNKNLIEYYHNSSWLEHGGAPERALKISFVYQFDSLLKKLNKYNKNENKIIFSDIEDSLLIIVSSFSNITSYENQTKKAVTNKGIYDAMVEFFKRNLEIYFIENPIDSERIASQILINKRSREDAERSRLNFKKKLSSNLDIVSRVSKFVDCRSKKNKERELFIVEGDSALGACKQARDPNFQAIIPIRGKILNCLKSDINKILGNEIIIDIIKVLGCGAVIENFKNVSYFDIKNLKWNKVILCTDADVDGFQIRTLLLAMIYKLFPMLITYGKIFIAESPLYEINTKSKTFFAYNEKEKENFLSKIGMQKYMIQRSKGLGENEPDMMNFTTMNPKTRRLIKVMPEDADKTSRIFDILLGNDLEGRKKFIMVNGHNYTENLDLS